jgi:hypothetical protein
MKNGNAHETDIPAKVFWYVENGRSYGQTAEALNMPKATVYKVYKKERERRETFTETAVNDGETAVNEKIENANVAPEKPFTPVSEPFTPVSFWSEWKANFHPADLVFYGCVSIGCIGISGALPVIGMAVAALWFCVAALFLHRTKMFARVGDIVTLALIEIMVGVPAHIAWANNALWANVTALPIEIQMSYGGQMWTGRGVETPFYLACYCAGVLVFFGGAAVAASTLAVQNQTSQP